MNEIVVIGSYNVGLWLVCDRMPRAGETRIGRDFGMGPGGKGSNQAIAAARMGGPVSFIAKVGDDGFGAQAKELFAREGLSLDHILTQPGCATGAGLIFIDEKGENAIGIDPGANSHLSASDIEQKSAIIERCAVLLLQLEIPLETVERAAQIARRAGAFVILNPAPARDISDALLQNTDLLTPNESEAQILTGIEVKASSDALEAGRILRRRGARAVIVTMGEKGAVLVDSSGEVFFLARPVAAIDTTGAGDAFNGVLAWALAQKIPLRRAIEIASMAGAFCATRMGVIDGLPRPGDLRALFGDDAV